MEAVARRGVEYGVRRELHIRGMLAVARDDDGASARRIRTLFTAIAPRNPGVGLADGA